MIPIAMIEMVAAIDVLSSDSIFICLFFVFSEILKRHNKSWLDNRHERHCSA